MAIKIGNLDINSFKVGSDDCKIYLGDTLLYPTTPPTPSFDGKWLAIYSDSHTESAECDSTSAITYNELQTIGTNLVNFIVGNCATSIGQSAFQYCRELEFIFISSGVTSIGNSALFQCRDISSIVVDGDNTVYDSRNNCNSIIKTSTNELIAGSKNTIIPNSVTSIGKVAFSVKNGLSNIDIPDSVTSIGVQAFYGCPSLTTITIGSGVTFIDGYAFANCTNLQRVTVNSNNATYDSRNNCNAIIETNTNTLLYGCRNTIIPNTVTTIGQGAFSNCSGITSCIIPSGVTTIGQGAFEGCSGMTTCTIGSGVTRIGNTAFRECSSLSSVTIPDSVTSIGEEAFQRCSGMTSCTIGSSVSSIGEGAFGTCTSLTSVTVNAIVPPQLGYDALYDTNECPIYVPSQSVEAYKSATNWSDYADRIQAILN